MRVELRTLAFALAVLASAPVAAQMESPSDLQTSVAAPIQSPSDKQEPAAKEMKSPSEMQEPAAAWTGSPADVRALTGDPLRMARAKARCRLEHGLDCDTPEGLREWLLLDRSREEAVSDGSRHLPPAQSMPGPSRP